MDFKDIIGNADAKDYLSKSVKQNNILHSYLFSGTEGIGKLLIAKEFSKMILCHTQNEHCDCKSCIAFDGNNHPDFTVINEDCNDNIKVETIRNLTEKVYEKPILSNKKVYIINNCDKMTVEAQNCLLKTLEEPPEFIVIILITANENLILNTIKSRCMTVKFHGIEDKDLINYCKNNLSYVEISDNLLKSFDGSIGKAIKLKDSKDKFDKLEKLISNLEKISIIELLQEKSIFDRDNINDVLDYMIVCLYSNSSKNNKYLDCIKTINECSNRLRSYSNFDMTIDNMLLGLWEELNESSNRC